MSEKTSGQAAHEKRLLDNRRKELIELIDRFLPEDGAIKPLDDLYLFRVASPGEAIHSVYKPSLCVVAQGGKEFFLGEDRYVYDPSNYLIVTAELPLVGQVLEASTEKPYLSFHLELPPALVGAVIAEIGDMTPQEDVDIRAINVSTMTGDILDAVLRIVRLIDTPSEAPFIAPMITKELIYRLWMGEQRDRLLHIVHANGNTPLIVKAIEIINQDFKQPLSVEEIANDLGMSVSGFHHHFKAVTAMSPLQYQKRLRLQRARHLLLGGSVNATDAAFEVGYNDVSHFSREYKGLFGLPPMQDIDRLRAVA